MENADIKRVVDVDVGSVNAYLDAGWEIAERIRCVDIYNSEYIRYHLAWTKDTPPVYPFADQDDDLRDLF